MKLAIVNDQKIPLFNDIAEKLIQLLEPLFDSAVQEKKPSCVENTLYFVLNPHHPDNQVKVDLNTRRNKNIRYVGWDITNAVSVEDYNRDYGMLDLMLVDTWEKQFLLRDYESLFLPYGIDMVGRPQSAGKNIDVAMIGMSTPERSKIVDQCRQRGWTVFHAEKELYGAERDQIAAQTKIMLDVPRAKQFLFFPVVRECLSVVNRCLLISSAVYLNQKAYVVNASSDQIADTVEVFLQDAVKRQKYLNVASWTFRELRTLEYFKRAMQWLNIKK